MIEVPPPPPPPLAEQKKGGGRKLAIILSIVALVVVGAIVAVFIVVFKTLNADPGDDVPQPHRAAVKAPRPAAGEPSWTAPDHHWVGLSKAWSADHGSLFDFKLQQRGLVSDGKRAIEFRDGYLETSSTATAMVTAFDGATGKRAWQTKLQWAHTASPVAGNGVVIVPSGEESTYGSPTPLDYVALDSATGKRLWRAHVDSRTISSDSSALDDGRSQPGGALLNGVFYYGDGNGVVGVDARTGKKRYAFTSKKYSTNSAPIVAGGRIAVLARPTPDDYPETYEVHTFPPDLKRYTSYKLPGSSYEPDQLAANGDVLVSWGDSELSTTDVRTGRLLAHVKLDVLASYGGVIGRTLLVRDRAGANDKLAGYDLLTGRKRWDVDPFPDDYSLGMLDVADGTALVAGDGLAIIDPNTGKSTFTRPTSFSVTGGLAAPAGGHLVVSFDRGIAGYR